LCGRIRHLVRFRLLRAVAATTNNFETRRRTRFVGGRAALPGAALAGTLVFVQHAAVNNVDAGLVFALVLVAFVCHFAPSFS
jgi:hypothetical protein